MKHSFLTRTQKGFTLIELMIVVGIIAIFAAVAIPTYTDYLVRRKVVDAPVQMDVTVKQFPTEGCTDYSIPSDEEKANGRDSIDKYVKEIKISTPDDDAKSEGVLCEITVNFVCGDQFNCTMACPEYPVKDCLLKYEFKKWPVTSTIEEPVVYDIEMAWLNYFVSPAYAVRASGVIAKTSTVAQKYWPNS